MDIMRHVCLASATYSKIARQYDWNNIPVKHRCGGRVGTIWMSLADFAKRIGDPHQTVPVDDWYKYDTLPLLDGAGKVSAVWWFETPRGPVQVGDYWWNASNELSVRAADTRAWIWFRRWCRVQGFACDVDNVTPEI